MIGKAFLFAFLMAVMAQAQTLTLISGNGEILAADTGQGGGPIVFQLTSQGAPLPNTIVTFANIGGGYGLPLAAPTSMSDGNGMVSVIFAPTQLIGESELFTLTASAPGSNVVTFYETIALIPPITTSLVTPPNYYLHTGTALVPGSPIAAQVLGAVPLPNVSLSIVPVPVVGASSPPGTILQSIGCSVNGAVVPFVLTGTDGIATCAPVFSQPNSALNVSYNSLKFNVVVGGSITYGPFAYNILSAPLVISTGPKNQVITIGTPVAALVSATGGTVPYMFALVAGSPSLPPGVSLASSGQFTGTPTTPGAYPFAVQVTDALGETATSTALGLAFDVSAGAFVFTPAIIEGAVTGVPYAQTVSVSGGTPPYKLSTGGSLPAGLSISVGAASAATFTISGTPTAAGSFSLSIMGVDAANVAFQALFPMLVTMPLTGPGTTLPPVTLNTAYSFQLTTTSGVGPYTFTSTDLPPGLQLAPGGLLSGTPTTAGLDAFSMTVTDAYQESVVTQLILAVSAGPLTVTSPVVLPAAVVGTTYSQQLPAPTGGVPPYAYMLTGAVPTGVTVTPAGLLTGNFSTAGSGSVAFQVAFQVTDALGATASGTLEFSVNPIVPVLSAVANGASSAIGPVSPGEVVSLYGTSLGPSTGTAATVTNGAFSTQASGVQVKFGTESAPVLFVSAGQVNAIVPFELVPGTTVPVTVIYNGVPSAPMNIAVQEDAPGIFLIGQTQGAILNDDNTVNSSANGASIESFVQIYATGGGPLTPQLADGQLATGASTVSAADVSITIGGLPAQVLYAGSAPGLVAGVLQLNVFVPDGVAAGPAVPMVLTIGDQSTISETVTLGIQ